MPATALNAAIRFTALSNVVVTWVPTMANYLSPTRAELNAGTDVTGEVAKAGISGFTTTGNTVAVDDLKSGFTGALDDGETADTATIMVHMSKTGTDIRTLWSRNVAGYVVIFDTGDTAGRFMDIWPATVIAASKQRQAGAVMDVTFTFQITQVPARNVVVPA